MPLNERSGKRLRFSDREVCKYELAGLCPYGLFRNTKSDLGAHAAAAGLPLLGRAPLCRPVPAWVRLLPLCLPPALPSPARTAGQRGPTLAMGGLRALQHCVHVQVPASTRSTPTTCSLSRCRPSTTPCSRGRKTSESAKAWAAGLVATPFRGCLLVAPDLHHTHAAWPGMFQQLLVTGCDARGATAPVRPAARGSGSVPAGAATPWTCARCWPSWCATWTARSTASASARTRRTARARPPTGSRSSWTRSRCNPAPPPSRQRALRALRRALRWLWQAQPTWQHGLQCARQPAGWTVHLPASPASASASPASMPVWCALCRTAIWLEPSRPGALQGKQVEATVMSESLAEAGDVDGSMLAAQQAESYGKQHEALLKQVTEPDRLLAGAPAPALLRRLVLGGCRSTPLTADWLSLVRHLRSCRCSRGRAAPGWPRWRA